MYHSITFGDGTLNTSNEFIGANTWEDWHLLPASRPSVAPPGVSMTLVEIPGREEGPIDLGNYLTGGPVYGDRSGSWQFLVANDYEGWVTITDKIAQYLHGKRLKCVFEDEPDYYYEGRFSVNEWKSGNWNSSVVIDYVLSPEKHTVASLST